MISAIRSGMELNKDPARLVWTLPILLPPMLVFFMEFAAFLSGIWQNSKRVIRERVWQLKKLRFRTDGCNIWSNSMNWTAILQEQQLFSSWRTGIRQVFQGFNELWSIHGSWEMEKQIVTMTMTMTTKSSSHWLSGNHQTEVLPVYGTDRMCSHPFFCGRTASFCDFPLWIQFYSRRRPFCSVFLISCKLWAFDWSGFTEKRFAGLHPPFHPCCQKPSGHSLLAWWTSSWRKNDVTTEGSDFGYEVRMFDIIFLVDKARCWRGLVDCCFPEPFFCKT